MRKSRILIALVLAICCMFVASQVMAQTPTKGTKAAGEADQTVKPDKSEQATPEMKEKREGTPGRGTKDAGEADQTVKPKEGTEAPKAPMTEKKEGTPTMGTKDDPKGGPQSTAVPK
ncbi:MAG TPA: hypothetical protein PLM79_14770 [Syntrophobacteraceae bacterium]|nr:hypothetical protein [Syntrophobacteraceae bacterium]